MFMSGSKLKRKRDLKNKNFQNQLPEVVKPFGQRIRDNQIRLERKGKEDHGDDKTVKKGHGQVDWMTLAGKRLLELAKILNGLCRLYNAIEIPGNLIGFYLSRFPGNFLKNVQELFVNPFNRNIWSKRNKACILKVKLRRSRASIFNITKKMFFFFSNNIFKFS